jgi:succinate-semialdehyde dehydrogenase/glutarate-semialdehyde dehydrogenase
LPERSISLPEWATAGTGAFAAGSWQPVRGADELVVRDPATGEAIARVSSASPADAADVMRGTAASTEWRSLSVGARAMTLRAVASALNGRADELAEVIVAEAGKPRTEAVGEVATAADWFDWFADEVLDHAEQEDLPVQNGKRPRVAWEPVGTVVAITPWNDPLGIVARKLAPALAAGCSVVLKPSPETPLTAISLTNLLSEAGLPSGALGVVVTDRAAASLEAMLATRLVRKVTFTGSTRTGRSIGAAAGAACVPASLELGGNAPFIVLEDADLERAAADAVLRKFRNAGQGCSCVNRLFVHERVADPFLERLVDGTARLRLGHGLAEGTTMGPLIRRSDVARIGSLVADARERGATLVHEGALPEVEELRAGNFVAPVILDGVPDAAAVAASESFGPVLPVLRFSSEEEAIERANAVTQGLAGYVYSADTRRALDIGGRLEVGLLGINDPSPQAVYYPVGGVKESGHGVEGGSAGLYEFRRPRAISVGLAGTEA